ncbi:reverse transcriptase family protein [Pseudoalteromonas sp. H105]|uniref:reverse transcriptase family protein n=1 Tax=Pseudoalteromonas sp. H105 TaxID=1348393 RepID=UPI001F2F1908|nr:reverse transcriptase family protein [Pseudoalteromonas sp. H105]
MEEIEMKKITLSKTVFDILDDYSFFDKAKGLTPLSFENVNEFKIGKKFTYTPESNLKPLHKKLSRFILNNYLSHIPLNQSSVAYQTKKSYFDFIEPHRNNYFFIRIDLKNFFHSISPAIIKSNFLNHFSDDPISESCPQSHAKLVYNLITLKLDENSKNKTFMNEEILPMGFPLSPVVSNIIFRKIDILIEKFCDIHHIKYTRYADDMLFSSKGSLLPKPIFKPIVMGRKAVTKSYKPHFIHSERFLEEISILLNLDGFKLNRKKTMKAVNTLSLNGYTISGSNFPDINGTIRISNKKTKLISQLIHELNSEEPKTDVEIFKLCFRHEFPKPKYKKNAGQFIETFCINQINNKLIGYVSYLKSIIYYHDDHNCLSNESIDKYSKIINELSTIISKRVK